MGNEGQPGMPADTNSDAAAAAAESPNHGAPLNIPGGVYIDGRLYVPADSAATQAATPAPPAAYPSVPAPQFPPATAPAWPPYGSTHADPASPFTGRPAWPAVPGASTPGFYPVKPERRPSFSDQGNRVLQGVVSAVLMVVPMIVWILAQRRIVENGYVFDNEYIPSICDAAFGIGFAIMLAIWGRSARHRIGAVVTALVLGGAYLWFVVPWRLPVVESGHLRTFFFLAAFVFGFSVARRRTKAAFAGGVVAFVYLLVVAWLPIAAEAIWSYGYYDRPRFEAIAGRSAWILVVVGIGIAIIWAADAIGASIGKKSAVAQPDPTAWPVGVGSPAAWPPAQATESALPAVASMDSADTATSMPNPEPTSGQ